MKISIMKYQDEEIYHIYNRGCDKNMIFFNERNYKFLIRKMKHNSEKFNVKIIVFCLMPNHYHFLLQQNTNGSISNFLKSTFTSYSLAVNKEQKRSGTLFESIPQSILIDKIEYLQYLFWYIHYNPVKSGLVVKSEDWLFSNYLECIGRRNLYPFDLDFVVELFGSQDNYKKFMENFVENTEYNLDYEKYIIEKFD